jgi:hypothetical protein
MCLSHVIVYCYTDVCKCSSDQSVSRHARVSPSHTNSYVELSWYHFQTKHEKLANFSFLLLDLNRLLINSLYKHHNGLLPGPIIGRVSIIYAPTIGARPFDSGDMRNYRMACKSADGRHVRIHSTRKWLIGDYNSKKHLLDHVHTTWMVLLLLSPSPVVFLLNRSAQMAGIWPVSEKWRIIKLFCHDKWYVLVL